MVFCAKETSGAAVNAIRAPLALRRSLIGCAAAFILAAAIAFVASALSSLLPENALAEYFFRTQDAPWIAAIAALLVACAFLRFPATFAAPKADARVMALGLAAAVFACGALGSSLVFDHHHLSRDEVMAEFDAMTFRAGHFIAPVDPEWRSFAKALAPRFMLPVADGLGFSSQYLPGNALLRALVGSFGDSDLTSPLLAALSVIATFGVARRLWPGRRDVAIIAPLLVATSSQVLVTSMTSYAMSAHLALNLLWLWLFLRGDRVGHAGAILVGALACGLHQVVFHPLFVAPFIYRLWRENRRLAAVYGVSYALICLFWMNYFQLILNLEGMAAESASGAGLLDFAKRAVHEILFGEKNVLAIMLMNLLRFVSWQNPFLLPLALLAYRQIRNGTGIARELAAGLALTLYAMTIILSYQGHGWGYRYLHGLIGSMALLAAYGWVSLTEEASAAEAASSRSAFAISCAFAVGLLFPARAWQAHDFVAPYAKARIAIERAGADVVLLDKSDLLFGEDLVRNDPFLRNKPKVLDLTYIDEAGLAALCQRHSVSLFDASQGRKFGIAPDNGMQPVEEKKRRAELRAVLEQMPCGAPLSVEP